MSRWGQMNGSSSTMTNRTHHQQRNGLNGIREEHGANENNNHHSHPPTSARHGHHKHAWALPFTSLAFGLTLPTCKASERVEFFIY